MSEAVVQNPTCALCGACCAMIALRGNKESYRWYLAHPDYYQNEPSFADETKNAQYIVDHFMQIDINLAIKIQPLRVVQNPYNNFYMCASYDPERKICTDHENRPPMCRNFPTKPFGPAADETIAGLTAYPQCSFWWGIPRSKWPKGINPLQPPDIDLTSIV